MRVIYTYFFLIVGGDFFLLIFSFFSRFFAFDLDDISLQIYFFGYLKFLKSIFLFFFFYTQ